VALAQAKAGKPGDLAIKLGGCGVPKHVCAWITAGHPARRGPGSPVNKRAALKAAIGDVLDDLERHSILESEPLQKAILLPIAERHGLNHHTLRKALNDEEGEEEGEEEGRKPSGGPWKPLGRAVLASQAAYYARVWGIPPDEALARLNARRAAREAFYREMLRADLRTQVLILLRHLRARRATP
jgi:hypothetical protein